MKFTATIFSVSIISLSAFAQVSLTALDQNNCSAIISDIGEFFNDPSISTAGYEVPAGSGKTVIYSAAIWYAGTDINGQLKLAAPQYYPSSQDMWPGALTNDGAATLPNPNPLGQTLWTVSKSEILNHINNYNTQGYVTPQNILNWPAHGSVNDQQDYYLAPFVDINNNGNYEPLLGEYPCIKGDKATYTIVNDKGSIHGSLGDPIGLEVHYMFYQYNSVPELMDVTFIDARIINRGTQTLFNFVTSFWVDSDIGNYNDDYFGTDSTRNLIYAYNADSFDENGGGNLGYGQTPPAVGIVCLNSTISSGGGFTNGAVFPNSDPMNPAETFNFMNGTWANGTPFLNDLGQPTKFQYSGDPNDSNQWSELSSGNVPGDRRMMMSVKKDDPLTPFEEILSPFEEMNLSFAVVYAEDSTNLASVSKLFEVTDTVQYFFDNMMDTTCFAGNVGIEENTIANLIVYPNPSSGEFHIELEDDLGGVELSVFDLQGRIVFNSKYLTNNITFGLNEKPGSYLLQVKSDHGLHIERIVIK